MHPCIYVWCGGDVITCAQSPVLLAVVISFAADFVNKAHFFCSMLMGALSWLMKRLKELSPAIPSG